MGLQTTTTAVYKNCAPQVSHYMVFHLSVWLFPSMNAALCYDCFKTFCTNVIFETFLSGVSIHIHSYIENTSAANLFTFTTLTGLRESSKVETSTAYNERALLCDFKIFSETTRTTFEVSYHC